MSSYRIVPASIRHVRPMAACMRAAGFMALARYGDGARQALHGAFVASHHCRTALIENKPVAMWGAVGPLLGEQVHVWLVLSDMICSMPRAIVREARTDLEGLMDHYADISAVILPDDVASVRFAGFLGFHQSGDRIPVGDGYFVPMRLEAH